MRYESKYIVKLHTEASPQAPETGRTRPGDIVTRIVTAVDAQGVTWACVRTKSGDTHWCVWEKSGVRMFKALGDTTEGRDG